MITLISEPIKTVSGVLSNVKASRSQIPFQFSSDEIAQENLKINIQILDDADVPLSDIEFKYSPDPTGYLFLDVGPLLTQLHEDLGSESILFKLEYWETWTGNTGTKTKTSTIQRTPFTHKKRARFSYKTASK